MSRGQIRRANGNARAHGMARKKKRAIGKLVSQFMQCLHNARRFMHAKSAPCAKVFAVRGQINQHNFRACISKWFNARQRIPPRAAPTMQHHQYGRVGMCGVSLDAPRGQRVMLSG